MENKASKQKVNITIYAKANGRLTLWHAKCSACGELAEGRHRQGIETVAVEHAKAEHFRQATISAPVKGSGKA
jgi:hypothetical protein